MGSSFSKTYKRIRPDEIMLKKEIKNGEEDDSTDFYTSFINKEFKIKRNGKVNLHENLKICYDKKYFNYIPPITKLENGLSYQTWIQYLISYLEKLKIKEYLWVGQVIKDINNKLLVNERKFLDLFLIQEIALKTIGIRGATNEPEKVNPQLSPERSSTKRKKLFSIHRESFHKNLTNLVEESAQSKLLSYHINKPDHPLNIVVKSFSKYFCYFIETELAIMKEYKELKKEKCDKIIEILQKTIIKMQVCLKLMYCKITSLKFFDNDNDDSVNIVTDLFFSNEELYRLIYKVNKILLEKDIKQLKSKLFELKGIEPVDLDIHDKFSLDDRTLKIQSQIDKKIRNSTKIEKKENVEDPSEVKEIQKKHIRFQSPNLSRENENPDEKNKFLYKKVVLKLKEIQQITSPYDKLVLISGLSSQILDSIDYFWKNYTDKIPLDFLNIHPDEVLNIIMYIFIKSNFERIQIHLKFIKDFTTRGVRSSKLGYYFVSLEATLTYVLKI